MLTVQLLYYLLLMKTLNADGACSIALLHHHCLDFYYGNLLDFGGLDCDVEACHFIEGKKFIKQISKITSEILKLFNSDIFIGQNLYSVTISTSTISVYFYFMLLLQNDHHHQEPPLKEEKPPKKHEKHSPPQQLPNNHIQNTTNDKIIKYPHVNPLTSELTEFTSIEEEALFYVIDLKRKQVETNVYTSLVEDQYDYLQKLFKGEASQKQGRFMKDNVKKVVQESIQNVCDDILVDSSYQVKKKKKKQKDGYGINSYPQNVIKIRQKLIRSRLSGLLVDINQYNNSNWENQRKNRAAKQFVDDMQKVKEEGRMRKEKRQSEKREKQMKDDIEKRQFEMRIRQENHENLKRKYDEKRKIKEEQKLYNERKSEEYQDYLRNNFEERPLFKKIQDRFFENFVLSNNEKKMAVLNQIKEEHAPLDMTEIEEHERQYLQIREDNEYEKNAKRMLEYKARRPIPKYYKGKGYKEAKKKFESEIEDPLDKKLQMYQRKWEYSTQIKVKFSPKISSHKREEWMERLEEDKKKERNRKRNSADGCKIDGNSNLQKVHKYVADLKARGKVKKSETVEVKKEYVPRYKNYLRDRPGDPEEIRHSLDLGSLKRPQYATIEVRKRQQNTFRRSKYLENATQMQPNKYMEEKKKLEEDYLESAKAKMAILNLFK